MWGTVHNWKLWTGGKPVLDQNSPVKRYLKVTTNLGCSGSGCWSGTSIEWIASRKMSIWEVLAWWWRTSFCVMAAHLVTCPSRCPGTLIMALSPNTFLAMRLALVRLKPISFRELYSRRIAWASISNILCNRQKTRISKYMTVVWLRICKSDVLEVVLVRVSQMAPCTQLFHSQVVLLEDALSAGLQHGCCWVRLHPLGYDLLFP